eukprot:scaffold2535_cov126-Cylindrotheca_fusiformis.AAC.4
MHRHRSRHLIPSIGPLFRQSCPNVRFKRKGHICSFLDESSATTKLSFIFVQKASFANVGWLFLSRLNAGTIFGHHRRAKKELKMTSADAS